MEVCVGGGGMFCGRWRYIPDRFNLWEEEVARDIIIMNPEF